MYSVAWWGQRGGEAEGVGDVRRRKKVVNVIIALDNL